MIQMRSEGGIWRATPPRRKARVLVVFATALAIALVAWALRPADRSAPVMRVALGNVPEKRVAEFGHEMPRIAMFSPVVPPVGSPLASAPSPLGGASATGLKASGREKAEAATRPQPRNLAQSRVGPDENGLLPIEFTLQQGVSSQVGGVGVAKTIASEAGQATGLTIFLIKGSLIEVDRGELISALATLGASEKADNLPAAGDNGRLSLDRVRTAGLDLSYDAIRDRLILRP